MATGNLASTLSAHSNATEGNWLAVLWKRKATVIVTVLVFVVVTELVTATLTRVYSASATLIVAQPGRISSFDTTQADEEAARSYADVLSSPSFADQVAAVIDHGATGKSIQSDVSIAAVPQTQLMTITAEYPTRAGAKKIADTYANLFVRYAPRLAGETGASVTVANYATLPTSPARPRPLLYGLVAALLGLAAGVGLAFLRERFDIRIRSVDEFPKDLDIPILAYIPERKPSGASTRAFAESFRMLRTSFRMLLPPDTRSVAITSWSEGEGKTTVVYELALAITATGNRTLVIDADIHRIGLSTRLHDGPNGRLEPGLSDYLVGAAEVSDAVEPIFLDVPDASFEVKAPGSPQPKSPGQSMLDLMPRGQHVTSLSNLLETPRGRAALPELNDAYDAVIIDTPPLSIGADAPAVAARVDGVILIVDLSKATTKGLRNALRQLESANATILGIVVNRDPQHPAESYSYYGYAGETNGDRRARARNLLDRARDAFSR